ncbi:hypothetical protein AB1E18_001517 [Capra hircus]
MSITAASQNGGRRSGVSVQPGEQSSRNLHAEGEGPCPQPKLAGKGDSRRLPQPPAPGALGALGYLDQSRRPPAGPQQIGEGVRGRREPRNPEKSSVSTREELGECGSLAPSRARVREGRTIRPRSPLREPGVCVCSKLQQPSESSKEKRVFVFRGRQTPLLGSTA